MKNDPVMLGSQVDHTGRARSTPPLRGELKSSSLFLFLSLSLYFGIDAPPRTFDAIMLWKDFGDMNFPKRMIHRD